MNTIILGVGRSGTTALYHLVQELVHSNQEHFGRGECDYVYEPFLWHMGTFNNKFAEVGSRFNSIESVSIEGLYHHQQLPLFDDLDDMPMGSGWLDSIVQPRRGRDRVTKMIRACGRLRILRRLCPDAKFIFAIRNPLDVINSILPRFSFLGPPYHRSDWTRLKSQAQALFESDALSQELFNRDDRVSQELAYWYWMNRYALEVLSDQGGPVLVVPHHVLVGDRERAVDAVGRFLDLVPSPNLVDRFEEPVGPVTKTCWLTPEEVQHIMPYYETYLSWLKNLGELPVHRLAHIVDYYRRESKAMTRDDRLITLSPMALVHELRRTRSALAQASTLPASSSLEDLSIDRPQRGRRAPSLK